MSKKGHVKVEKNQVDKFRDAARELGCDESEEAFDANLKRIAKSPPPKGEKEKEKSN